MNNKIKLLHFLRLDILLVSFYLIIPMILYLNYLVRGFILAFPLFFIWLFLVLNIKTNFRNFYKELAERRNILFLLATFIGITALNYFFVISSQKSLSYIFHFINYFFLIIVEAYYSSRKDNSKYIILFLIIVTLGIQAVISIPYLLSSDQFIIRKLASGQLDAEQNLDAIRHGVGSNGLYSSLGAVALVGFVILNKFSKICKILLIIALVSILLTIFISTFFSSILLLMIGSLVLALRFRSKILHTRILLTGLLIFIGMLYFYNTYVENTHLLNPIIYKVQGFMSQEKDVTGRTNLAEVSWQTFSDNPFWGVGVPENGNYDIIGEHMPWIDVFANFGFFGFLPLLLFFMILIKRNWKFYFENDKFKAERTAMFAGTLLFILSNFISPMLVVPNSYIMFILFYASFKKGD